MKIDITSIETYSMSDEKEKTMFNEGIFVFDSSALLKIYEYSTQSQKDILENIFKKLKKRLWIPNYVEYEFLKNRRNVIIKPIKDKYGKLKKDIIGSISTHIEDISLKIKEFSEKGKNNDIHPYMNDSILKKIKIFDKMVHKEYTAITKRIDKIIEKRTSEINTTVSNDETLNSFVSFFDVGPKYKFKDLLKIIPEGQFRYKEEIAPGYMDGKGISNKNGIQKYGDLIIWKQILNYAKESKKPIILIGEDVVKGDWCNYDKKNRKIINPRVDLITEMRDFAGVDFWIYTLGDFIYKTKDILGFFVSKTNLNEIENIKEKRVEGSIKSFITSTGEITIDIFYSKDEIFFEIVDTNSLENREKMIQPEKKGFLYKVLNEYLYLTLGVKKYVGYLTVGGLGKKMLLLGKVAFEYDYQDSFEECEFYLPDNLELLNFDLSKIKQQCNKELITNKNLELIVKCLSKKNNINQITFPFRIKTI